MKIKNRLLVIFVLFLHVRIIMTSSAAGIYGNFGQANYSAGMTNKVDFELFEVLTTIINISELSVRVVVVCCSQAGPVGSEQHAGY
jgi:hypothetical protein